MAKGMSREILESMSKEELIIYILRQRDMIKDLAFDMPEYKEDE